MNISALSPSRTQPSIQFLAPLHKITNFIRSIFSFLGQCFARVPRPWGGVENAGNSCTFSVVLQELAAMPECYDPLLFHSLQRRGGESAATFGERTGLQQKLLGCLQQIRSGNTVSAGAERGLAASLRVLGWEGRLATPLQALLYRIMSHWFPLPQFDVHEVYERLMSLLIDEPGQIFIGRVEGGSVSAYLAERFRGMGPSAPRVVRVSVENCPLEEEFERGGFGFSLRVVHVSETTPSGHHVIVYEKVGEGWVYCNDRQVSKQALPASEAYLLVYARLR